MTKVVNLVNDDNNINSNEGEIEMNEEIKKVKTEEEIQAKAKLDKEIEDSLGKLEDHIHEMHKQNRWQWLKGFGAGYGSAIAGLGLGCLLAKGVDKLKK